MTNRLVLLATALAGSVALAGCHPTAGPPTQSVCPTNSSLTYANFGKAFFDTYCQTCHAGKVTGANREGAPDDHTFDTVELIRSFAEHIDTRAAAGPGGTNTDMPREDPRPSDEARRQLGEWLACGAP